jgi:heme/copper-type cytochrome/quinol oxidase subunit 4
MAAQLVTLLKSRITLVWLALIAATLVSWRVGTDHGLHAHLATTIVVCVAFIKVRFVGLYFMELREAPVPLRAIFEGYCVVVCALVITMYLAGGG